jgi:thioredoxin-related protein
MPITRISFVIVSLFALSVSAGLVARAEESFRFTSPALQSQLESAKKLGKPLLVLATTETCVRTHGLRDGIKQNQNIQTLMNQYANHEIAFGAKDFRELFQDVVKRDKTIPTSIGSPSLFLFTPEGKTIFAGPNRVEGMKPDEQFISLLVQGIKESGGLRPAQPNGLDETEALERAKKSLASGSPKEALTIYLEFNEKASQPDEETKALAKQLGVPIAKPQPNAAWTALIDQIKKSAKQSIQESRKLVDAKKYAPAAMKLAESQEQYSQVDGLSIEFEKAWKSLVTASKDTHVEQAARMAIAAKQMEETEGRDRSVQAYQQIISLYPKSVMVEYCKHQIEPANSDPAESERVWKSASGKHEMRGTLLELTKDEVTLRTAEGKTITVKLNALSKADQEYARQRTKSGETK